MQLDLFAPKAEPVHHGPGAREAVFVRHRWARRYILRVMDDGRLRVTLPRWGSKREALAFVERSSDWISGQLLKQRARPVVVRPDEPALRKRAIKELPPQLMALAGAHGIAVARVSIRNQRSRWGACSSTGSITLNWRLVLVPDFVREYVMIHELMHRREMNHSKRFWKHVAAACPRFKEARAWLLTDGQELFRRGES
ncbi:MAG TPA: SprT family zinc-dependent metalloprotease [Vicinamibacterales bacterium]|nr:SprT family zinc-dependent metalloprotease [Vicinamibacterales bacterium]